jgi:hypothetical protein
MSQSLSPARNSFRPTTARGSPAGGLVVAVLLHAALIAVTLFTWQHKLEITDETPASVPVDLVTLADKTNIAPTVAPQAKPVPQPPQPAPATPPPLVSPPPVAEAAPEPLPRITPKPEPAPQPAVVKPPPLQPKPEQKKPKSSDIDALLAGLTTPAPKSHNGKPAARDTAGVGDMNAMNADLAAILKSEVKPCWTFMTGAPHADQLIPKFRIQLGRDGNVVGQPQLSSESAAAQAGNPYMRAANEAARRAIMTCGPYKLPLDRYDQWRDFSIAFKVTDMDQ